MQIESDNRERGPIEHLAEALPSSSLVPVEATMVTEDNVPSPNLTQDMLVNLRNIVLDNSSGQEEGNERLEESELHIVTDMSIYTVRINHIHYISQIGDPIILSTLPGGFQLQDGVVLSHGVVWSSLDVSQEIFLDHLNQNPISNVLGEFSNRTITSI